MTGLATLHIEELKATFRGRFDWLGTSVVPLAPGGWATVAAQDIWLDGCGVTACDSLVYTGPVNDLGASLDAFEGKLTALFIGSTVPLGAI